MRRRRQTDAASRPGRTHYPPGPWTALSNGVLLLVSAITLAFFIGHLALDGTAFGEPEAFRTLAAKMFLLLCAALAFSLPVDTVNILREGLKRNELPPCRDDSPVRERIFRTAGPARPLFQACTEQFDRHFRRFYAFHRFQPPYVAYFYYAKKGLLSLLGLPCMKAGFLLLFLAGYAALGRGENADLQGWPFLTSAAGCSLVGAGFLLRAMVSYRKVWLRVVEENNLFCLALSCTGRSKKRWFEAFCRPLGSQSGAVSCSIQER